MQDRSATPSMGNIIAFALVAGLALVVFPLVMKTFFPPQPQAANAPAAAEKAAENEKKNEKPAEAKKPPVGNNPRRA